MINKVEELISEIESLASEKGMYLHRYQSNLGRYRVRIVYALHESAEKPRTSTECSGPKVTLNNREGATTRCEAYRKLTELKESIQ